jgi:hypothetical protein
MFTLPTFNLTCNIWNGTNPLSQPPDVISVCNLAFGRRTAAKDESDTGGISSGYYMYLLLPAGTDIRAEGVGLTSSAVECPAASGRYYHTYWVDDSGKGFPNEHRVAVLVQTVNYGVWPSPIP